MRYLTKLILITSLTSCMGKSQNVTNESLPDNSKSARIDLRDSLGIVSFSIPIRFDTFFTWTNRSDCGKPCDLEQYRYQPRSLPIFMESGFYYHIPDIPIDQFTIVHSGYFPFHRGDTAKNLGRHENFKNRLSKDAKNGTIVHDTIVEINDRYFSVVSMSGYDEEKKKYFAQLSALTTIKSNEIEFHYDIKNKDTINLMEFYQNSMTFLRSVRLSNGL